MLYIRLVNKVIDISGLVFFSRLLTCELSVDECESIVRFKNWKPIYQTFL